MSLPQQSMRRVTPSIVRACAKTTHSPPQASVARLASSTANSDAKIPDKESISSTTKPSENAQNVKKKKTQAELDRELQLKMQGIAGDGGDSGVEYEDGQPVSMKRSVKNNMFRYI